MTTERKEVVAIDAQITILAGTQKEHGPRAGMRNGYKKDNKEKHNVAKS